MSNPEFTVTDGYVEYEHRIPPSDFEHKLPKVRLSFTVAEGSNPAVVVEKVMAMAVATVEVVLGGKRVEAPAVEATAEPPKQRRTRVPGGTLSPQPPGAPQSDPAAVAEPQDPALVSDTASGPSPEVDPAAVTDAAPPVDDDDLGIGTPEPAEVTDEQLQAVVQPLSAKMRAKVQNINALRDLIEKANAGVEGKATLQSIPQANRASFIAACKALNASIV